MLYKNLHKIHENSLISITYKLHGTSGISSKVLCKKKLNWGEKFLKWMGVNIIDTKYDYLYSSRKVIKNEELNPNAKHYYDEDIWKLADNKLKPFLQDGMTLYYEIVGYLPNGGSIQKDYDYGYPKEKETFGIYIYRITYTNPSGKVFEFSAKQVQNWCEFNGLNPVPEIFYGYAGDLFDNTKVELNNGNLSVEQICTFNQENFLEKLKKDFNDKDCYMCTNKVPEEGVVVRIEGLDFEAYKQKSFLFYARETKNLDKDIIDMESEN